MNKKEVEQEIFIEYTKKIQQNENEITPNPPNQIFFRHLAGDNAQFAQKSSTYKTFLESERFQTTNPILSSTIRNVNFKVKRFINNMKRLINLNSFSNETVTFLNDLTYFNEHEIKNAHHSYSKCPIFSKTFYFIARFIEKYLFFIKKFAIKTFYPFEKKKIIWDIFLFFNTLLLFFYIPLTMAFNFFEQGDRDVFMRVQLGIYIVDLIINLNTCYIDNGVIIKERIKVFIHYVKHFFVWDLLTILSLLGKNNYILNEKEEINLLNLLQLMFFMKFKLFQIRFKNIKEIFCLDKKLKGIFDLFVLLTTTLLFAHFFACMFYWIAKNSDEQRTWLKNYSFNTKPLIDQYLYSLYWSTMTMMTVGYGDIVPQNNFEVSFTMLTIFVGCIIVGYNINKIGNIFHDMNEETMKIQENINKINQFMDSKHINSDLQMRIRAYLKFVWRKQNEKMNNELLNLINHLSDSLKEELFLESYGDFIRNNPIFANNFSYDFLSALIKRVKEQSFMKDDIIFEENRSNPINSSQNLYCIISGQVEIFQSLDVNSGIVIKKFQERETFGQYVFFTGFNDNFSARAATYTQVYTLSRESFLETLALFPRDHEKYCQIKDQILLYEDYHNYNLRCLICNKKSHLSEKCDLLHYVPDKETVILRLLFSQEQNRDHKFQRKCGKKLGFFAKNRKIENQAKILQSRLKKIEVFEEDEENSSDSCEFQMENLEKSTVFERQKTIKMQEIAPSSHEKPVNRESNANLGRISRVFQRKKQASVLQINENELEFERLKQFDYYFPQGNVNNFIEKLQKVRSLARKGKKFSKESKENKKKNAYFLSKRSVSFEKENKEKTQLVQSDDEKNRRKSFFDRLKMSPSHKFFHKKKKEKAENWTFYQVATEVTNKVKN